MGEVAQNYVIFTAASIFKIVVRILNINILKQLIWLTQKICSYISKIDIKVKRHNCRWEKVARVSMMCLCKTILFGIMAC